MNDRERFVQTMSFSNIDRIPLLECAFWGETLERWLAEGLPQEVVYPNDLGKFAKERAFCDYFGFDRSFGVFFHKTVRINIGMYPGFSHKILSEEIC